MSHSRRFLLSAAIAAGFLSATNSSSAATKVWVGTDGDLLAAANYQVGGSPTTAPSNADLLDFEPESGVKTLTVGGSNLAANDMYFNNEMDGTTNLWTVNGTGVISIGRASTRGQIVLTGFPSAAPGAQLSTVIYNAPVSFVGTSSSGALILVGSASLPAGSVEFNSAIDGTGTRDIFLNPALAASTIKVNAGFTAANTRRVVQQGSGDVTLGNSPGYTKNYIMGGAGSPAVGNTIVSTPAAFGNTAGYTEMASSAGAIVLDHATGFSLDAETVYFRGRADGSKPQLTNKSGDNTFTGAFVSESAGVGTNATIESQAGTLTFSSTSLIRNNNDGIEAGYTLNLTGASNGVIQSTLQQDSATRNWSVVKSGAGSWTMSANQTYTGNTTISGGTFIMNGNHTGGGLYTVGSGGALAGSGTISASVLADGILAPGNSPGTLTVGGLTLLTTTLNFELDAVDHTAGLGMNDLIDVNGLLDLTGGGTLNVTAAADLTVGSYDILQFDTLAPGSDPSNIALGTIPLAVGTTASIVIDSDSVNLVVSAVPEPSTIVLGGVGLVGLAMAAKRRKR